MEITLPETNIAPEMDGWNTMLVSGKVSTSQIPMRQPIAWNLGKNHHHRVDVLPEAAM